MYLYPLSDHQTTKPKPEVTYTDHSASEATTSARATPSRSCLGLIVDPISASTRPSKTWGFAHTTAAGSEGERACGGRRGSTKVALLPLALALRLAALGCARIRGTLGYKQPAQATSSRATGTVGTA